jgi:lantibiotic modifying enzyme
VNQEPAERHLFEDVRGALEAGVERIAQAAILQVHSGPGEIGVGFMGGTAGIALFLHHFGAATGDQRATIAAREALDDCLRAIEHSALDCSLAAGWCGVLWVAAHLSREGADGGRGLDFDLIDTALFEYLKRDPAITFDLIGGLCGIGVYALERDEPSARQALVSAVADLLRKRATRSIQGTHWFSKPELLVSETRTHSPHGHVDLGLAHGTPGVIAWLSAIIDAGLAEPAEVHDLRHAVRWLRGFAGSADNSGNSVYPVIVRQDQAVRRRSRLAWCYGDLSVAAALLAAATVLADDELRDHVGALLTAASNRDTSTSGVADASFCHGAAGTAHLFSRLGAAMPEANRIAARAAAARWLHWLVDFGRRDGWQCQFKTQRGFAPRIGLLEGASGVGLTILTALGAVPGNWDRGFLCGLASPGMPLISARGIV